LIVDYQRPSLGQTDLISKTDHHFKPLSAKASRLAMLVDHPRPSLGQIDL
jgi:hypothetical protein